VRQAVILVGGRGTRLGKLARETPKPLLPIVGDVRFLDYLIENIARHGIEDIVLLAGHFGDQVETRYAGKRIRGAQLRVIVEPSPAGTAGALRYAEATLDDTFLMLNGDSIVELNYLALAQARGSSDQAALALRRVPDAARYGRVETRDGRVIGFHEKDASFSGEALISSGVYVLRKSVLGLIDRVPASIETDVFPKLAAARAIAAFESTGYFLDIGLPDTLAQARAELPEQMRRGAVFFDRDGTLIRDDGYTHRIEDLEWLPGAVEAIRACNDAGRLVIVVTNQAGIARGLYTEADMRRFHAHMQSELRKHGAHIDAFYHCPHHADGVVERYTHADHPDRKPNPGMLRRAFAEWPIERAFSFLVGDADSDVAAAAALGLPAYKIKPNELLGAVRAGLEQRTTTASLRINARAQLQECAKIAREWLFNAALPFWWATGFDKAARCFHERIALDGAALAYLPRRTRVQARQTIVYAQAGTLGWQGPWREATEAGAAVLIERCIRADGGTRHLLAADGSPSDDRRDLYDAAFVVLALSHSAMALGDRTDLIAAAERVVDWVESNWSTAAGGFHEGDLVEPLPHRQNPHMHMFEALLALYEATQKPQHLARAAKLADLLRDRFFDAEHGALREYFDDLWRPAADEAGRITEPGHQFEWSWLLHRWRTFSGANVTDLAESLRLHGELYGVDPATGIALDEVYIEGLARSRSCRFWPHTERMKANLARYELTGDPEAALNAVSAFDALKTYLDTPTPGLWRDKRNADGSFVDEAAPASSFYHAIFALGELMRVSDDA